MNNVDKQGLLYRIDEYIQYLIITCIMCIYMHIYIHIYIYIYIIESGCCKPETDIML